MVYGSNRAICRKKNRDAFRRPLTETGFLSKPVFYMTIYSMDEPPVTIQAASEATVKAPVYTRPVLR